MPAKFGIIIIFRLKQSPLMKLFVLIYLSILLLIATDIKAKSLDEVLSHFDKAYELLDIEAVGKIRSAPISAVCILTTNDSKNTKQTVFIVETALSLYSEVRGIPVEINEQKDIKNCSEDRNNIIRIAKTDELSVLFKDDFVFLGKGEFEIEHLLFIFQKSGTFDFAQVEFNVLSGFIDNRYTAIRSDETLEFELQKFIALHEMNHFFTARNDADPIAIYDIASITGSINEYAVVPNFHVDMRRFRVENKLWWKTTPKGFCWFDIFLQVAIADAEEKGIEFRNLRRHILTNYGYLQAMATKIRSQEKFSLLMENC